MSKLKPISMLLRRDIHNLEYDPATQYRFNAFWAWFWLGQMPLILLMIWQWPHAWKAIAFLYLTEASLWANFANHFGAMSAALAAKQATQISTAQIVAESADGQFTESAPINDSSPSNEAQALEFDG